MRPQQAVLQQKDFILETKQAWNEQIHSQTYTVSRGRKESKQTVQLICSSKQPNQQNLFSRPSSTTDIIPQPIKSNKISNQSLNNYLLNHVNRIYKSNIIISQKKWEVWLSVCWKEIDSN